MAKMGCAKCGGTVNKMKKGGPIKIKSELKKGGSVKTKKNK